MKAVMTYDEIAGFMRAAWIQGQFGATVDTA